MGELVMIAIPAVWMFVGFNYREACGPRWDLTGLGLVAFIILSALPLLVNRWRRAA